MRTSENAAARRRRSQTAHIEMAALVQRGLGVLVLPSDMRRFFLENWQKLSDLAHLIHERGAEN